MISPEVALRAARSLLPNIPLVSNHCTRGNYLSNYMVASLIVRWDVVHKHEADPVRVYSSNGKGNDYAGSLCGVVVWCYNYL